MSIHAHIPLDRSSFALPDKIMVATDFNDVESLIPHVVAQAKASNARIILVHAMLPENAFPSGTGMAIYPHEEDMDRSTRLRLLGVAERITSLGVPCDAIARHGFAARVIREQLERSGAQRLIIGSHGRGAVGQFLLGSVARELLRTVHVPVFTIGPRHDHPEERTTPRKILHPVSLIGDYKQTVSFAVDIAGTYAAELTLLYVLPPPADESPVSDRSIAWAGNALKDLARIEFTRVPAIRTQVTSGDLDIEISRAANLIDADWVILGADGEFPVWPFGGSTAYRAIASSIRPVLTLRHEHKPAGQALAHPARYAEVLS